MREEIYVQELVKIWLLVGGSWELHKKYHTLEGWELYNTNGNFRNLKNLVTDSTFTIWVPRKDVTEAMMWKIYNAYEEDYH